MIQPLYTAYMYLSGLYIAKVFKQSFWMSHWGSATAKRTTLWSNSRAIRKFSTRARAARVKNAPALAKKYKDKAGRQRYQGNRRLKASQLLDFPGSDLYFYCICTGILPCMIDVSKGISSWICATLCSLHEDLPQGKGVPQESPRRALEPCVRT